MLIRVGALPPRGSVSLMEMDRQICDSAMRIQHIGGGLRVIGKKPKLLSHGNLTAKPLQTGPLSNAAATICYQQSSGRNRAARSVQKSLFPYSSKPERWRGENLGKCKRIAE